MSAQICPGFLRILFLCVALCFTLPSLSQIEGTIGDFSFTFKGIFRPEMFFAKNTAFLNNNNDCDKIWFMRHTFDTSTSVQYYSQKFERMVAETYFTVRNKIFWGDPQRVEATTISETRMVEVVSGPHQHTIPRMIFWLREGWLAFDLTAMLGLETTYEHSFVIGAFPFELGRGIALGVAFEVSRALLGLYTDFNVDQFAFGAKVTGQIAPTLYYDLYAALLDNKSASLRDTLENIVGQRFGRKELPQRGFGVIEFAVAARLLWKVFDDEERGNLTVQPYVLFVNDPEEVLEVVADAQSKLGTFGFAAEYYGPVFEGGFDYAMNIGHQKGFGIDKNQTQFQNRSGRAIVINSEVQDQNNNAVPFVPGSQAQRIIFGTFENASQNGQVIGQVDSLGFLADPVTLRNDVDRFRNPFDRQFCGWMFVMDAAWWPIPKRLRLAITAGIATGDDGSIDPLKDTFCGFIGIQEIYSGKRVRSAFELGGAGNPVRSFELSQRATTSSRVSITSEFTNLVYTGCSAMAEGTWPRKWIFHPNILFYWQERPIRSFDEQTMQLSNRLANTFLGTEANLFLFYHILIDLQIYFIGSIFFPGGHYNDVKGEPVTALAEAFFEAFDRTGFTGDMPPRLGANASYTFNLGLQLNF